MTIASCIWIGIEHLAIDVAVGAVRSHRHTRQVFCGGLAAAEGLRAAVNEQTSTGQSGDLEPEWHDADPGTIIGAGLLSDLLRQRSPVEEVVLVLPPWDARHHPAPLGTGGEVSLAVPSLEVTLDHTRGFVESVVMSAAAARAVMSPPESIGMTILSPATSAQSALGAGLQALTETWTYVEQSSWQDQGLQLALMQPAQWLSERASTKR
ncbi:MAG: hypothetical protein HOH52_01795 [Halieaceae bacterium]|nr:hypothetical protein [Halieaceae bacterium]